LSKGGHIWYPVFKKTCPILTKLGPLLTKLGPLFYHLCPLLTKLGPLFYHLCPLCRNLDPNENFVTIGSNRDQLVKRGHIWQKGGQIWSKRGHIWYLNLQRGFKKTYPVLTKLGPLFYYLCPLCRTLDPNENFVTIGSNRDQLVKRGVRFGQKGDIFGTLIYKTVHPVFKKTCPVLTKLGPLLTKLGPLFYHLCPLCRNLDLNEHFETIGSNRDQLLKRGHILIKGVKVCQKGVKFGQKGDIFGTLIYKTVRPVFKKTCPVLTKLGPLLTKLGPLFYHLCPLCRNLDLNEHFVTIASNRDQLLKRGHILIKRAILSNTPMPVLFCIVFYETRDIERKQRRLDCRTQ
jgi:hypothetical protein